MFLVDLGTTVVKYRKFGTLTTAKFPNPLLRYGSDVLTRVSNLSGREKEASKTILEKISEHVDEKAMVAANTINTFMLRGEDFSPLTVFPYGKALPTKVLKWKDIEIISLPTLDGPVGSDSLVVDWWLQLEQNEEILKIDFGTNIEISIISKHSVWTTSVPGGSVFSQQAALAGEAQVLSWLNHLLSEVLRGHVKRDGSIDIGTATINPATCKAFLLAKSAVQTAIEELVDLSSIKPKSLFLVGDLGMLLEPSLLINLALVPANIPIKKVENAILKALDTLYASYLKQDSIFILDEWIKTNIHYINFAEESFKNGTSFNTRFLQNLNFELYNL